MKTFLKYIFNKISNMFGSNDFMMEGPGGPGPAVSGKWVNKNTGNTIIVRDSIIAENGMQVICSNGATISMEEFSQFYIQVDDDFESNGGPITPPFQSQGKISMGQLMQGISADDLGDINALKKSEPNQSQPVNPLTTVVGGTNVALNSTAAPVIIEETKNDSLIKKLFDKIQTKPEISVDINWANIPEKEISTLVNFLDVPVDEIANYIYNTYVNADEVSKKITDYINSIIAK